jgi:hypothetical protein
MKKRFKGQFNSLLKTIDVSIDHRGAKNAKICSYLINKNKITIR